MAKIETLLMKLARRNDKLANDTYKKIIRFSPFIDNSMSIKSFKEAFHSPKTLPEYRAILLASLYDNKVDFRNTFREFTNNKYFHSTNIAVFSVVDIDHTKAFALMTIKKYKLEGVPIAFNKQMRAEVQKWQPQADRNILLTRSLLSGSVHAQKAAFLLSEVKTAIYAAADMLITNVKANDPLLIYLDISDRPSPEKLIQDMTEEIGHYNETQEKFNKHLQHMTNEFQKIIPFLNKMGIETAYFEHEFDILKADVLEFVSNFYITREGELDGLYRSFKNINRVITETIRLADKIDWIDLSDKSLYTIGRLEVIPTFVDYNPNKISFHRRAADGSVVEFIEEKILVTQFNRNV